MDITGSPTMASPRGGCACHIARSTPSEAGQAVPGTPIGSANRSSPTKSFQLRSRCWPAVPTLRRGPGCASRCSGTMPPDIPRSSMAEASTAAGIPSIPEGGIPQYSSRRSSTDEGVAIPRVYVGANDAFGHLFALDARSGRQQWHFRSQGIGSSPVVVGGLVYIGSSDGLYALNAVSGIQQWSFHTGGRITSSLAVAKGIIYVRSDDGTLYALDALSGSNKWHWAYPTDPTDPFGDSNVSSPVVANGIVYLSSDEGKMYALDARSGQQKWHWAYPVDPYPNAAGSYRTATPIVVNGIVYEGSNNGNLYALDAFSG